MKIFGRTSSKRRSRSRADVVGRLGLLLFVGIAILPIAFSLLYAVAYSFGAIGLLSEGVTLTFWQRLFETSEVWYSFGLSIYVAAATVVATASFSLFFALFLNRPLQYGPLSYIIYFPLALPATVAAFLVFQVFSGAGYGARVLLNLGLISDISQFPNLVNDPYAIGIILAHVGLAVPFFTLLFVQVYNTERVKDLTNLAQTLGASPRQALYRVAAPILLTKSFTNIVLLFIAVLGSYEIPLLLGRQAPQMLSVLTMRKYAMFDITEKPEAFIVAVLYTLVVLTLIIVAFRKGRLAYDH